MADQEVDQNVQVFKIKRLIRNLEKARGNGTSMISLIIPPKEQVAKQQKVKTEKFRIPNKKKNRNRAQESLKTSIFIWVFEGPVTLIPMSFTSQGP